MHRFCRYELRTTDIDAARAFYSELLGAAFWGDGIEVGPLPAQVAARGAPPHWLGRIGVDDVVAVMLRFVERGATRLGAVPQGVDAPEAIIRDPSGAIVALTSVDPVRRPDRVAWHLLGARDEAGALAVYSELFGWVPLDVYDLGAQRGRHVTFAWEAAGQAVGSAADVARLPHVHPQWLFFFHTRSMDEALATVRGHGGLTLPPMENATGDVVAVCDDPQGAAFALYEPRR